MALDPERSVPAARKRFYLGGPVLVGMVYFFGHFYPWVRSCLVRSIPGARDAHGGSPSTAARLVSLPWCLAVTLDRLNTVSPPASGEPAVPSGPASPSDHGKTELED
jgi:hypothetical protein